MLFTTEAFKAGFLFLDNATIRVTSTMQDTLLQGYCQCGCPITKTICEENRLVVIISNGMTLSSNGCCAACNVIVHKPYVAVVPATPITTAIKIQPSSSNDVTTRLTKLPTTTTTRPLSTLKVEEINVDVFNYIEGPAVELKALQRPMDFKQIVSYLHKGWLAQPVDWKYNQAIGWDATYNVFVFWQTGTVHSICRNVRSKLQAKQWRLLNHPSDISIRFI